MSLNPSGQNKARPLDTQLRAVRHLSISQNPERDDLLEAYHFAVAEAQSWVAECESALNAYESERQKVLSLTDQLGNARADAAHLVDTLAAAYASNARKAADAQQRGEELAAAVKELSALRTAHEELRAHDHQLLKRCGDLNSEVSRLTALCDELSSAREAEQKLWVHHERLLKICNDLHERTGMQEQELETLRPLRAQADELRDALNKTRAAHAEVAEELHDTAERFLAFVNDAHAERRLEVQTLSELVDEAQQGKAWAIKRFLRRLWPK